MQIQHIHTHLHADVLGAQQQERNHGRHDHGAPPDARPQHQRAADDEDVDEATGVPRVGRWYGRALDALARCGQHRTAQQPAASVWQRPRVRDCSGKQTRPACAQSPEPRAQSPEPPCIEPPLLRSSVAGNRNSGGRCAEWGQGERLSVPPPVMLTNKDTCSSSTTCVRRPPPRTANSTTSKVGTGRLHKPASPSIPQSTPPRLPCPPARTSARGAPAACRTAPATGGSRPTR